MKRRPGRYEESADAAGKDGVCATEIRLLVPGDGGIHRVRRAEEERALGSERRTAQVSRETYMVARRRVQAGARKRGVENRTVDQMNREPRSRMAIGRTTRSDGARDPHVHPLGPRSVPAS